LQIKIFDELYRHTKDIKIEETVDMLCDDEHICPHCFNPLIKRTYHERRGDDMTYDEEITEYTCPRCL